LKRIRERPSDPSADENHQDDRVGLRAIAALKFFEVRRERVGRGTTPKG
jgi:hypothetical protein